MKYDDKYSDSIPVYRIIDQYIQDKEPLSFILNFIYQYKDEPDLLRNIFKNSYYIGELLKYPWLGQFSQKQLFDFLDIAQFEPVQEIYLYWQYLAINSRNVRSFENAILKRLRTLREQNPGISYPTALSKAFDKRMVGMLRSGQTGQRAIETTRLTHAMIENSVYANYIMSIELFEHYDPDIDNYKFELLKQIFKVAQDCYKNTYSKIITSKFLFLMLDSPSVDPIYKAYLMEMFGKIMNSTMLIDVLHLDRQYVDFFKTCHSYEEFQFNSVINWTDIYVPAFIMYVFVKKRTWFNKWYKENANKINNVLNLQSVFEVGEVAK